MRCVFSCYSNCTLKSAIYSFTAELTLRTSLRTRFNYDFSSLFRRIHHDWICRIQNHHIFFFLRNSNYEFRVSVTIGVLCQTTDVTLVTSVSGIQHKCDATVLVPLACPFYDTSTSDTWNANYAFNTNLMYKLSFIHIMLQFLYMFRAINAHLQEVILYTCSLW
jgi:hypothetical protein